MMELAGCYGMCNIFILGRIFAVFPLFFEMWYLIYYRGREEVNFWMMKFKLSQVT